MTLLKNETVVAFFNGAFERKKIPVAGSKTTGFSFTIYICGNHI
jgi:hypothetical protein